MQLAAEFSTEFGRNEVVKDEHANLVCVWIVDSVDAAVHSIPAQNKGYASKDRTELPLGDGSSGIRLLGDLPASPKILGAANSSMADLRGRRFRVGRDLSRIERHSPPGKAMAIESRDKPGP